VGTIIDESISEKERFASSQIVSRAWIIHKLKIVNAPQQRTSADEFVMVRERAATDFMKGMSHELHTPLHVIIGLCQILERDRAPNLTPVQLDAVERMERNARSLLQTVNHLLDCLRSGQFD
jgi:signal transduction histidine kinase